MASPLSYTYQITNSTCSDQCNGSLIIFPTGGQPPYSYSINGTTFQSSNIFTNLCPSTLGFTVKDSDDTSFSETITIGSTTPQTFTVSLNVLDQRNLSTNSVLCNWEVVVAPPIPDGVTLTGNLVFNVEQIEQGPFTSSDADLTMTITATNSVNLNGANQTLSTSNSVTGTTVSTCNSALVSAQNNLYSQSLYNFSLTKGTTLTGTSVSVIDVFAPLIQYDCVSTGFQTIKLNLYDFVALSTCTDVETDSASIGIFNHTVKGQVS